MSKRVLTVMEDGKRVESCVRERCGVELNGLDILEIGPGQFLAQMTYLSTRNRVVGIDLDVIVRGFHPLMYARMLRINGARRTAKTVGRKLLGIDRRFARELSRHLKVPRLPPVTVEQMDVCDMKFADESVDMVYSRSVFHHLPNPAAGIEQVARVLRPGGVVYISIHPYTSETGSCDPRIFTERRSEVRWWPHLRPQLQAGIAANAFLNKLRLDQWRDLFQARMPGVEFDLRMRPEPELQSAARALQEKGELAGYSLTELLIGELVAIWKKPS
jgi:SAM-dependent methyltransferase